MKPHYFIFTGLTVGDSGLRLGASGGAAGLLVNMLATQFKDSGGENFLELLFGPTEAMPDDRFVVTIQRVNGLTPGEKLAALAAEVDRLKKDAARYQWLRTLAERGHKPPPYGVVRLYFSAPQSDEWNHDQDALADLDCAVDRAIAAMTKEVKHGAL